MEKLYFVSKNEKKFQEMKEIVDVDIEWFEMDIPELQTDDVEILIKQKAIEAFKKLRRAVLVEHTALRIHAFNNLPGLQTSYFYSQIGYEAIVDYCVFKNDFQASVESIFCYCDGKKFVMGRGKEDGLIKEKPVCSENSFAWDKIFCPTSDNNEMKTYEEQGEEKSRRSMRRKAWEDLKPRIHSDLLKRTEIINDNSELENLAKLIKEKKVLLFIGSGISASIGFPSWSGMIGDLGKEEGYEPELFEIYGDKLMLAEYVDRINKDRVYEYVKNKFSLKGKDEIRNKLENSDIYKILLELDFPVIYTTNYDHLIEEYYGMKEKKYTPVVKIGDMEKIVGTRIMKFHGDIDNKESIVLCESQYFSRMDFQSFMDVQLQADILQYHILYLGYSLSDINIKLLLYLAGKRWEQSGKRKKSYIFTATPNQIQKMVFEGNDIITFSGKEADKKKSTLEFLQDLLEKMKDVP